MKNEVITIKKSKNSKKQVTSQLYIHSISEGNSRQTFRLLHLFKEKLNQVYTQDKISSFTCAIIHDESDLDLYKFNVTLTKFPSLILSIQMNNPHPDITKFLKTNHFKELPNKSPNSAQKKDAIS